MCCSYHNPKRQQSYLLPPFLQLVCLLEHLLLTSTATLQISDQSDVLTGLQLKILVSVQSPVSIEPGSAPESLPELSASQVKWSILRSASFPLKPVRKRAFTACYTRGAAPGALLVGTFMAWFVHRSRCTVVVTLDLLPARRVWC